jgi:hypothetical protein
MVDQGRFPIRRANYYASHRGTELFPPVVAGNQPR